MSLYNGSEAAWPHGKMVHLARKRPEPQEVMESMTPPAAEYPFGCCLSFDDETMAALGLTEMPTPGDVLEFFATAQVTCASEDPITGKRRVELQITEMLPHEEESAGEDTMEEQQAQSSGRRQRFYGESMSDYDRDVASYNDNREAGPRP